MWFSISTLLNCFFVYQIATATLNSLILPDAVPYDGDEALLKAISIAEKELKIFTYSYPESLKSLPHYECMPSSLDMKAEYFIPEYLKKSVVNTNDPNDADLFLINHNFSCLLNYRWQQEIKKYKSRRIFGRDYVGKQYMQPMLRHIQTQYPYFNRSGGSDHLFILAIDAGPYCQHDLPHNLKRFFVNIVNVTFLLNYGFSGPAPKQCTKHHILRQPNKDIVIPQFNYWSPPSKLPLLTNRIIDSFFKGGPNCAFHCKKIRTKLLNIGSIPQLGFIYVSQSPLPLKDSYFALCPAGYAPWSIRLYDAIFSHSIPVILANEIIEPFERFLNWKAFTEIETCLRSITMVSLANRQSSQCVETHFIRIMV
eukprot:gene809-1581_t